MFVQTVLRAELYLLCSIIEFSVRTALPLTPHKTLKNVLTSVSRHASSYKKARKRTRTLQERRQISEDFLTHGMDAAVSLQQYEQCTLQLDQIQGHEDWKEQRDSVEPDYNPAAIEAQIEAMHKAASGLDLSAMQHLLRTGLSRNLGGMDSLRLYKHSWFGTKHLIDEYISTAIETIEIFVNTAITYNIATSEIQFYQQSLEDALKYFGRSALTLSGGALLGMKHIGVVKALWEAELLPDVISGSSAGSILATIAASHTDEEMEHAFTFFPFSDLACFDPPGTTGLGWFRQRFSTLWTSGHFFEMANLERVMKSWFGELTFREAHYKTGRILNICVSSADSEPRLLNYITAPDVYLWSAVCASCAVPGVFSAVSIWEKDQITRKPKLWMQNARQLFVDGSLDHDIPMRKLSEMFNVNFFIVSQVNPHVRALLTPEEIFEGRQPTTASFSTSMVDTVKQWARLEIVHRAQQAAEMGLPAMFYRWATVFNQQYTGDINIYPEITREDYAYLMQNPTPEFLLRASASGERATWPRMCRIKNCVAIELALVRAINVLRDRINFGPEARAARDYRQTTTRERSRRGRSARPFFRRRRTNSISGTSVDSDGRPIVAYTSPLSGPPTPGPIKFRRNVSMSTIEGRYDPSFMNTRGTGGLQPVLSPQAGLDETFGETLLMTATNIL